MYYCGIDVGTSGVKAVVFDERGREKKKAYRAYDLSFSSDGTRSLDAEEIWKKTKSVLREVANKSNGRISALSVSSFGEAFVILDESDKVLFEVMVSTDCRGEVEFEEKMLQLDKKEIISVCGLIPSATYSAAKLLYLKRHYPLIYAKTKKVMLIGDFIQYRLTGSAVADYSSACRTMLLDVNKLEWSSRMLDLFELEMTMFSELARTGTVIGRLLPAAAQETGLSADIQVVLGGHDQPMNAIGSGLIQNAAACSMGTSECMTPVFENRPDPMLTECTNLPAEPVWEEGKYCTLAYNPTSGLLIQWFFKNFSDEKIPPYDLFEEKMPKTPTRIMVQPYLMGSGTPYLDSSARFAMTGINIGTDRYMIYKAVLEGLVLDQKLNLEKIRMMGAKVDRLICTGRGSSNRAWLQLKADIMQLPISTLCTSETGALGCAAVCAAAFGEYNHITEAARNMSNLGATLEPVQDFEAFYKEKYMLYKELRGDIDKESKFGCSDITDRSR